MDRREDLVERRCERVHVHFFEPLYEAKGYADELKGCAE